MFAVPRHAGRRGCDRMMRRDGSNFKELVRDPVLAAPSTSAHAGGWVRGPTVSSFEGALLEPSRCAGTLELLVFREPVSRLGSFGREMRRWRLLPQAGGVQCAKPRSAMSLAELARCEMRACGNFSLMMSRAPSVYDNHLVRTLLGHAVYALPSIYIYICVCMVNIYMCVYVCMYMCVYIYYR